MEDPDIEEALNRLKSMQDEMRKRMDAETKAMQEDLKKMRDNKAKAEMIARIVASQAENRSLHSNGSSHCLLLRVQYSSTYKLICVDVDWSSTWRRGEFNTCTDGSSDCL
jgi:hypothetical protein